MFKCSETVVWTVQRWLQEHVEEIGNASFGEIIKQSAHAASKYISAKWLYEKLTINGFNVACIQCRVNIFSNFFQS